MKTAVLAVLSLAYFTTLQAGEIAFTFDDTPRPDSAYMSGHERSQLLFKASAKVGVKQAMFFVSAGQLKADNAHRLRAYVAGGHLLGSHGYLHNSANKQFAQVTITDIGGFPSNLPSQCG